MLNLSNVLFRIKLKLGIVNMATPFENLNETLTKIIQEVTIPTYSLYLPYRRLDRIDTSDVFEVIDRQTSYTEFLIPDWKNLKLVYINDIYYNEDALTNLGYYAGTIPSGMTDTSFMGQMMLNNISAGMINMAVPKMTFDFIPPRRLKLFNAYWSNYVMMDWSFEHSKSLNTIPDDALNSFMDLALLDVKENLYPTLSQYMEQQTEYGTIRLPIESWANAESERNELLNKWDDTYHLDGIPFWYG